MHDPEYMTQVDRKNKKGEKVVFKCPRAIADYNAYLGGVDHFDHIQSTYSIIKKSRKWWMKLFYFFLDSVFVNSFILYDFTTKEMGQKPITNLQFRKN